MDIKHFSEGWEFLETVNKLLETNSCYSKNSIGEIFKTFSVINSDKTIKIRLILHNIIYSLKINRNKLRVLDDSIDNDFEWQPKSNLSNFEVMDPDTEYQTLIHRTQGIGTIIIDPFDMYIKLHYDSSNELHCICCKWDRSSQCKTVLEKDLRIGYDVLYIDSNFKRYIKYRRVIF